MSGSSSCLLILGGILVSLAGCGDPGYSTAWRERPVMVSAESGVDAPAMGWAWGAQSRPAAAFDGKNYLVVWEDTRLQPDGASNASAFDIFAARVGPSGKVLDPRGIGISSASGSQIVPTVAYGGGVFLVAWREGGGSSGKGSLDMVRVSSVGKVLDKKSIRLTSHLKSYSSPAVSHDGTNFLVVWSSDKDRNSMLRASRVSASGQVLDAAGFDVQTGNLSWSGTFTVTSNKGLSLVAWPEGNRISGVRISASGKVLEQSPLVLAIQSTGSGFSVAAADKMFMVVWPEVVAVGGSTPKSYDHRILGARVGLNGKLIDANSEPLIIASGEQRKNTPRVSSDGNNFMVAWLDERNRTSPVGLGADQVDLYGARVGSDGKVLDTNALSLVKGARRRSYPLLVHGAGEVLLAWGQDSTWDELTPNIAAAFIKGGTASKPFAISTDIVGQGVPAVASGGKSYLIAWQDSRFGAPGIFATPVSPGGQVLAPAGIPMATMPDSSPRSPALAYRAGQYLVVWQDFRNPAPFIQNPGPPIRLFGTLVDEVGLVRTPGGLNLGGHNVSPPLLAVRGTKRFHAVAMGHTGSAMAPFFYRHVSVSDEGKPLKSWEDIIYHSSCPSMTSGGGTLLWAHQVSGGGPPRISAEIRDETGIRQGKGHTFPANFAWSNGCPAAAYGDSEYLLVWSDGRRGANNHDIYGARLTTKGALKDKTGFPICTDLGAQRRPRAVFDGERFLVTWEDGTRSSDLDLRGQWVSTAGAPLSMASFAIAQSKDNEVEHELASVGGGESLVVYTRARMTVGDTKRRVKFRRVVFAGEQAGEAGPGAPDSQVLTGPAVLLPDRGCSCRLDSKPALEQLWALLMLALWLTRRWHQ